MNFYAKLKAIFLYFWNQEIIRFLIAGGINTVVGGILLPYLFKFIISSENVFMTTFVPLLLGYIIWLPFAYSIQVKFVFQTSWEKKRFLIYPLTQIPNYGINQLLLFLFEQQLKLDPFLSLILAALAATPIMFILVRYVVKKKD